MKVGKFQSEDEMLAAIRSMPWIVRFWKRLRNRKLTWLARRINQIYVKQLKKGYSKKITKRALWDIWYTVYFGDHPGVWVPSNTIKGLVKEKS